MQNIESLRLQDEANAKRRVAEQAKAQREMQLAAAKANIEAQLTLLCETAKAKDFSQGKAGVVNVTDALRDWALNNPMKFATLRFNHITEAIARVKDRGAIEFNGRRLTLPADVVDEAGEAVRGIIQADAKRRRQ